MKLHNIVYFLLIAFASPVFAEGDDNLDLLMKFEYRIFNFIENGGSDIDDLWLGLTAKMKCLKSENGRIIKCKPQGISPIKYLSRQISSSKFPMEYIILGLREDAGIRPGDLINKFSKWSAFEGDFQPHVPHPCDFTLKLLSSSNAKTSVALGLRLGEVGNCKSAVISLIFAFRPKSE